MIWFNRFGSFVLISALLSTWAAAQTTRYVWTNSPMPGEPYATWDSAAHEIQTALTVAQPGDDVCVTDGVYTVTSQINVTNSVRIRSVNGPEMTTVAGGYPAVSNRCFYLSAAGAELSGFTITKGYRGYQPTGGYPGGYGGAVLVMTNGTVSNCVFSANYSYYRGGGAALYRGGIIVDCRFDGNSCGNGGGGLYIESNGIARRCTFLNNEHAGSGNGGGGAWINFGGKLYDSRAWNNRSTNSSSGGGIWINNGSLGERCLAYSNRAYHGGGMSVDNGSDLRSCLIYQNSAVAGGGGLYAHLSRVDGCTVAGNAGGYGGGIYAVWSNDAKNTICFDNASADGADWLDDGTVTYSHLRTSPALFAPGCTAADPQFRDAASGDYRLSPGSPLVNAGTNQAWMDAATDLDGHARILESVVDFGAHELDRFAGPLICSVALAPASGFAPLPVVLTGRVAGSNQTALVYAWDFENDGSNDVSGTGAAVVTNTYTLLGYHSPRLVVSNAAGETAACIKTNGVKVGPPVIHAATNGASVFPYASWAEAATNLADAIEAGVDGSLVLVSNGAYRLGAGLTVPYAMTIRSLNGRGTVLVDGNNQHCGFQLLSAGAQLDGLVVVNGRAIEGAGIHALGGVISNCAVYACRASNCAAGVYLNGGLLTDSDISSNEIRSTSGHDLWGAGVCAVNGALVRRCRIATNTLCAEADGSVYGAGLYLDGAIVEQSAIRGNAGYAASDYAFGGGLYGFNGGRIVSSVVETNFMDASYSGASGGGICAYDCLVTDTVIAANNLTAGYSGDGYGGGMMAEDSEIVGCTLYSNYLYASRYSGYGGGGYLSRSRMRDSRIVGNEAATKENHIYGGGVCLAGGSMLARCEVDGNTAVPPNSYAAYGIGVCAGNSTVTACRVTGNKDISDYGSSAGGGILGYGASAIQSCLLAGNFAVNGGGLSLQAAATEAANCTIVSNLAYYGGGLHGAAGVLLNSLVFDNQSLEAHPNHDITSASVLYSSTTPLLPGAGNRDTRPQFVNAAAGDYALLPGSPGVDDGFNKDWMTNATDLVGHARLIGGTVDRGAYELDPASGALACNPVAGPAEGFYPLQVVFTAAVSGANTTGLYYQWDFNHDGSIDLEGYGLAVVTNLFAGYGGYDVWLAVSNAAGAAARLQSGCVRVGPEIAYVATNGTHIFPYTNWVTAATNPHAALAAAVAGTRIGVGMGTHRLSQELYLDRPVIWEGQAAVTNVILHGGNAVRCFYLCHPDAQVRALTISGGRADYGGGVYYERYGLVSNCVVAGNVSDNEGGGLYFDGGGEAGGCELRNNATRSAENWGGGAYLYGGVLARCRIHSHTNGGVRINGAGLVEACQIYSNRASSGGGIRALGGTVRNCLIIRNQATSQGGGAYLVSGATTLESSTICANSAGTSGGGLAHISGASLVRNSIVRFNSAPTSPDYLAGNYEHTCAAPLPAGPGNTDRDPEFADATGDDYRLLPGSPCFDTGTNRTWMTNATDLAGAPRIINSITDMGAYELVFGTLQCNPSGDPLIGLQPLSVTFTGYVVGTNTGGIYYWWDFNGDGAWDRQGYGLGVVTQTYPAAGRYTITLAVSNAAGEVSQRTRANLITAAPRFAYVAPGGAHQYPYTNWMIAATDAVAAVAAAWHGSQVLVTDGVYAIRSPIELAVGAVLRSVNGPTSTVLDGVNAVRCLTLNHPQAAASGLTLNRGRAYQGGGAYFYSGMLSNCIISACYATNRGGGIYLGPTGIVTHCVLICNTGQQGGGVYMVGGTVSNCVIRDNRGTVYGGGVDLSGGWLENCLIVNNTAAQNAGGVCGTGSGGGARNCTITGNRAGGSYWGGGFYAFAGKTFINTILYGNYSSSTYSNYSGGTYQYSCVAPLPAGTGNIANDPLFADPASYDFRLPTNSPCVDTGSPTNLPARDIAGIPRPLDGNHDGIARCDMGVYELLHPEADSDADWLRDTNELALGTDPTRADTDADRQGDGAEIRAGTDPLDDQSFLGLMNTRRQDAGFIVNWQSVNGKSYTLARSTNLPQHIWMPIATNIAGMAPMNTVTDQTATGRGPWNYRIELE